MKRLLVAGLLLGGGLVGLIASTSGPPLPTSTPAGSMSFAALGDAPYYGFEDLQYRLVLGADGAPMKWFARIFGPALSLILGLATIPLWLGTRFGGSLVGFLSLLAIVLLLGWFLGHRFTKMGGGTMWRASVMGFLSAAPAALAVIDLGGPGILYPVIPLLLVATLSGGLRGVSAQSPAGASPAEVVLDRSGP